MDRSESDKPRESSVLTAQTGTHHKQIVHPGLIVFPLRTSLTALTGAFHYAWLADKLGLATLVRVRAHNGRGS